MRSDCLPTSPPQHVFFPSPAHSQGSHHSSLGRRHVKDFLAAACTHNIFGHLFDILTQLHFHKNYQKKRKKRKKQKREVAKKIKKKIAMQKTRQKSAATWSDRQTERRCVLELEKLQQLVCLEVNPPSNEPTNRPRPRTVARHGCGRVCPRNMWHQFFVSTFRICFSCFFLGSHLLRHFLNVAKAGRVMCGLQKESER